MVVKDWASAAGYQANPELRAGVPQGHLFVSQHFTSHLLPR